jgi:hypothetical protein
LAKILWVAAAFSSAGCVANHSIKRFDPIPRKKSSVNTIEEELVVQVLGTEHKGRFLVSDYRGPHTVHTRYFTHEAYRSYSIERMTVSCENFRKTLIAPSDQMKAISLPGTEGTYAAGTYNGEINTARSFDYVPSDPSSPLTIRVEGSIRIGNTSRPFVATRKFRYEVIRKVWLISFDDLMSI